MEDLLNWALANFTLYMVLCCIVLMAIIFVVLELVKIPLKKLTSKIENDNLRKLANKSIILLSFGLSVGLWYLLNYVLPKFFEIDAIAIILTGALPVVAYAVGDGVISGGGASRIIGLIKEMVVDKKADKEEVDEIFNAAEEEVAKTETTKSKVFVFKKNAKSEETATEEKVDTKETKKKDKKEKTEKVKEEKPQKEVKEKTSKKVKTKSVEDTLNDLLKS